ncbi:hypothetical protein [Streptomyces sp. AVP053U2]|nr:hypothetical protein [Streptomyces sp. AVP053U2]
MPKPVSRSKRWSAWRPSRGQLRILTFTLAMATVICAASAPRQ